MKRLDAYCEYRSAYFGLFTARIYMKVIKRGPENERG